MLNSQPGRDQLPGERSVKSSANQVVCLNVTRSRKNANRHVLQLHLIGKCEDFFQAFGRQVRVFERIVKPIFTGETEVGGNGG